MTLMSGRDARRTSKIDSKTILTLEFGGRTTAVGTRNFLEATSTFHPQQLLKE
jgi:hypothetical protein